MVLKLSNNSRVNDLVLRFKTGLSRFISNFSFTKRLNLLTSLAKISNDLNQWCNCNYNVIAPLQLISIILIFWLLRLNYRSSRPEVFCKKGVLRNFTKFAGKHLCQSSFFHKVAGLRPATLLKRGSGTGVFFWIMWNF